ncbi:alpha-L-fucosidase [bacterium]|nr:alpha-L-fucosidase [bacterium]
MIKKTVWLVAFISCLWTAPVWAQEEVVVERETDPLVLEKLEQWQDARFGLLMHWGAYSVEGLCESWPICAEPWITRGMDNYAEYKQWYESLPERFNPVDFDPEKWAALAESAGMRYVVFTTKHHDGFCMFDTELTDYKITNPDYPFGNDPRSNVTAEIFNAFRARDFMVGAYFSKPDWHSKAYWSDYWPTADRNCNYFPTHHPELWQEFKEFTYGQIQELMSGYGPIDILWLDGSWVRPQDEQFNEYKAFGPKNQDLDMDSLAALARSWQPGLIVVDRWVEGRHENYLTPEQKIPAETLDGPWETCMPMAGAWSYYPNDTYKPTRELLRQLTDVVSRGGNYLLNVGVDGQGKFPDDAVSRLEELAEWMEVNESAIHGTRAMAPYAIGKCRLTKGKEGAINAIYVSDEGEESPPSKLTFDNIVLAEGSEVVMLGVEKPLKWKNTDEGVQVSIPRSVRRNLPCKYAWVVQLNAAG